MQNVNALSCIFAPPLDSVSDIVSACPVTTRQLEGEHCLQDLIDNTLTMDYTKACFWCGIDATGTCSECGMVGTCDLHSSSIHRLVTLFCWNEECFLIFLVLDIPYFIFLALT